MLSKIYNFLLAQQPPPQGEDPLDPLNALKRFWPILVLIALSALSGFFKKRQEKSKESLPAKPETPTAAPPRIQHPRLPSYARKASIASESQSQPVFPEKSPTVIPRPIVQKPSSPTRPPQRPTPQKPRPPIQPPRMTPRKLISELFNPTPTAQPAQARHPKVKARPASIHPTSRRTPAPAQKITPAQAAAKRQMVSTGEAAELRQTTLRSAQPSSYRTAEPMKLALDQYDVLVRAILFAEILDKPMALRPTGSHQF